MKSTAEICDGCQKPVGFCICGSNSSVPLTIAQGTPIEYDLFGKPKRTEKAKKQLAVELAHIAREALKKNKSVEGYSAYVFFTERAKLSAQEGIMEATYLLSKLPWSIEELKIATSLLEPEGFGVDFSNDDAVIKITWY